MAGKTQFSERETANLTLEQKEAFHKALKKSKLSKNDGLLTGLCMFCVLHGVNWPDAEKRPAGRHKARRDIQGKFTKS